MKLTDTAVRALRLPAKIPERTFFDAELGGFGIRVRDSGAKSWLVQYDFGGKSHKITLGSIEALSAARARATAKDILAAVRLGRNPAAEKRAAKAKVAESFGALLPRYLAYKRAQLKPRSFQEVERHLMLHCRPLHTRSIDEVDQRAAAILLAKITENSGPKACNNTRASGSGYYSWLMREGLASLNPFANTNKAPEADPRERTPSDDELREIWQACPDDQYGYIVHLLMLLAARRTEIADLRWSEVDIGNALITLSAKRVKGRREHEIPLSAPALVIIKAQPRRDDRDLIFGHGDGGFQDWSKSKRQLDARILAARQAATKKGKAVPMPAWVLHDFRRAASTTMHERLGLQPHIIEECLGHAGSFRSGVAGTYNRSAYRTEKRRALDLWSEHLMTVVEGRKSKVVSLRA
jgi:integrase